MLDAPVDAPLYFVAGVAAVGATPLAARAVWNHVSNGIRSIPGRRNPGIWDTIVRLIPLLVAAWVSLMLLGLAAGVIFTGVQVLHPH
jgi:hypothetical protein